MFYNTLRCHLNATHWLTEMQMGKGLAACALPLECIVLKLAQFSDSSPWGNSECEGYLLISAQILAPPMHSCITVSFDDYTKEQLTLIELNSLITKLTSGLLNSKKMLYLVHIWCLHADFKIAYIGNVGSVKVFRWMYKSAKHDMGLGFRFFILSVLLARKHSPQFSK